MAAAGKWTEDHPALPDKRSLGDAAADMMRSGMGSWLFVGAFIAAMAIWMVSGGAGVDPFPFILLNLLLSTLAGLQGAILLISAKRADQIAGQLALHTDQAVTEILAKLERLERHLGLSELDAVEEELPVRADRDDLGVDAAAVGDA